MDRKELIQSPLLFQDNRIKRFYLGGSVMNEWRRMPKAEDSNQCEELLVTSMGAISKGEASGFGVSRTIPEQGGILLSELIQEYPDEILGREFQKYNPNQLSVLARAGDTKVRLVMQCHPRKADAQKYFHMPMGKTEAWYIARVREAEGEPACVRAGFKEGVTRAQWKELIEKQDIDGMLACLHTIEVKQGDTVLIPAGTPHCAGPNCLFVEFHECNDITVRTEKSINGMTISEEEMFYGLPLEEALNLFDYTTYSEAEVREKLGMRPKEKEKGGEYSLCEMIGPENNDSFGIDVLDLNGSYHFPKKPYHRVLVAVEHDVVLKSNGKEELLVQGHGALIPACCEGVIAEGQGSNVAIGIPFIDGKEVK